MLVTKTCEECNDTFSYPEGFGDYDLCFYCYQDEMAEAHLIVTLEKERDGSN